VVVGASVMLDATYVCVLVVLVNYAPGSSAHSDGSYCDGYY
jgi:hypothetical protein